jgi:tetratricopeptide (TPR) repeat protein
MERSVAIRDARRALADGHADKALRLFWWLAEQTHVPEQEYHEAADGLARSYVAIGRRRAAGFVCQYLGEHRAAFEMFTGTPPEDAARVEESRGGFQVAGQLYFEAGRTATAAICFEKANVFDKARLLWERLLADPHVRREPYHAALAAFNHGRCCKALGDKVASRRSMIEAVHLLEEAADIFESAGTRERAFDCFQVLLAMGADTQGAFENLAEGYLNCIRILKADNLRYYVLQYYEDFQRQALDREEYHAAATLLREAADYTQRAGLPYDRHYRRRSAETWVLTSEKVLERGHPAELAENALLAAIDLYGTLGDYRGVGECYTRAGRLPLDQERTNRYTKIAARYRNAPAPTEGSAAFPEYLRQESAYPDVWFLDLVEWEQKGDFREAPADLIASSEYPESIKRRALLCRLELLAAEESGPLGDDALVRVALRLGQLTTYTALSPLEKLYANGTERVRAAAMSAIRGLFFKRSFGLLGKGLRDEAASVRKEALEAVRALHFTHALEPLTRLYREHKDNHVRLTALQSVGKISSPDAAEFLLEVVRNSEGKEADLAKDLLSQLSHPEIGPLLRRRALSERTDARDRIADILRRRGEAVR